MKMYKQQCILESDVRSRGWFTMTEVTLKKWGNSQGIRIPKSVLNKLGIDEANTVFDLTINDQNEIVLKKQKKPESLKELFAGFDYEKYWSDWNKENPGKSKEVDWGGPVGKEIW